MGAEPWREGVESVYAPVHPNHFRTMKITTVVPFPASATSEDEVKINRRTAAPAPVVDPTELAANAAALELERRRLQEDSEALQLREANLREYEARLRALQSEMDATRGGPARSNAPFASPTQNQTPTQNQNQSAGQGRSMAPFSHDDAGLEAAWQKLHRAREFTEAEQAHLRDDRLAMRALEAELKQREAAVEAREARVAAQEELLAVAMPRAKQPREAKPKQREPMAGQQTLSAFTRLTRAPFLIAESLRNKSDKESEKASE